MLSHLTGIGDSISPTILTFPIMNPKMSFFSDWTGTTLTTGVPRLVTMIGSPVAVAEGPKEFLKDYTQVLLADAYGGYNGVVAGNANTRRLLIPCETKVRGNEENGTGDRARGGRADRRTVCGERQAKDISVSKPSYGRAESSVITLISDMSEVLCCLPWFTVSFALQRQVGSSKRPRFGCGPRPLLQLAAHHGVRDTSFKCRP